MLFLDLETTGLDAEECEIVELGIMYVNPDLQPISFYQGLIVPPAADSPKWTKWALDTHTASGLLDEATKTGKTVQEIELEALDFLSMCSNKKGQPVRSGDPMDDRPDMFGNSLRLDRDFLEKHMPALAACFHYRNGDVSAVRVFVNVFGLQDFPELNDPHSKPAHRAIPDLEASLRQARWYKKRFLHAR